MTRPHLPHHQRGSVLLVGMIFLTILMIGAVSLMNASVMNERITGNTKASANAFMAAEAGQLAALTHLQDHWGDVREHCSLNALAGVNANFDSALGANYELEIKKCGSDTLGIRSVGTAAPNAMRSIVFDIRNAIPGIKPPAAISCFGNACSIDPGNAKSAPIDGRNHPLSDLFNCSQQKCSVLPSYSAVDAVPSVYLADYNNSHLEPAPGKGKTPFVGKSSDTGTITKGNGKAADSVWQSADFPPGQAPKYSDFFGKNSIVARIIKYSNDRNSSDQLGSLDAPKITLINNQSGASKIAGNGKFSGYVVVSDGNTLELGGNTTFVGVIFLTECSHIRVHGTPVIYGAVIADATNCPPSSPDKSSPPGPLYQPFLGNGTPDIKYSKDAMDRTSDYIVGLVVDDWYEEY